MRRDRRSSPLLVSALVGTGIILGAMLRPLTERLGGSVPVPGWGAAAVLAIAAAAVGVLARSTWQSLHVRRERMTSDHGVKLLAIAKGSTIVGGLFGGVYLGIAAAFVRSFSYGSGRDRVIEGGAAGLAGLALLVAALLLERSLHVPGDDDEGSSEGSSASAA
ncbi:MAG: DUF3180 family protein [Aeromicrobium erythreum]